MVDVAPSLNFHTCFKWRREQIPPMIYSYIIGWYWWWIDLLSFHYGLKPSIWRYLFCLFLKGALNSAAKKWADFLKKERLISGCVPCWAWFRLKINLRCYIVEKSEINWFIFNFRNKLINVMAGASVDVFSLTVSCIVAIVTSKIFTCDGSISIQPIESEYWIWPNISAAI